MTVDENHLWYAKTADKVLEILNSSSQTGLSHHDVQARQKQYGLNELPKTKTASFLIIFLSQFKNPLIYLLLIAASIAFGIGHNLDALVIIIVLLINALIGSIQEKRAQKSMEALKNMTRTIVSVLRANTKELVDSKELVPGDILLLNEGDVVSADARLLMSHNLQVSESALTGESTPIWKTTSPLSSETYLADRTNMVYGGTHISKGKGKAIVIATGVQTEIGQIAGLTQRTQQPTTPLEEKITRFSKYVLLAALVVFALVVCIGFVQNLNFSIIFMVALSQVVSMVPEGLPIAMSVALAVGMQRMARRKAIVRKLDAVETLGSINVICTDKTGTLTRNEMTVTEIALPNRRKINVTGTGYSHFGEFIENTTIITPANDNSLVDFFTVATLCNDAQYSLSNDKSSWKCSGDPTEIALLTLVHKGGLSPEEIRKQYTRLSEIPFDSESKMMAVLAEKDGVKSIYLKGAPEAIIELCSNIQSNESLIPLDNANKEFLHQEELSMASKALRLLAFALIENTTIDLNGGWNSIKGHACLIGLAGQFDPPRPEVKDAVLACRSAGIRPIIVTGDHKITGLAVAKMLNIAQEGDIAIDGQELTLLSDRELKSKLDHVSVFARVHPSQKLRIVELLQHNNAIVAMTGDGVNDAPALVKADVGIAMGITGTEVAKEAAKIIITDDNFATIVHAVEEGRIVFRNLRKLLVYLVSTGLTELIVLFTALLFGLPLPLAAVQILWINLVTDGALSLPMILEPSEGNEMAASPIARGTPLFDRNMLVRMAFMVPTMACSTLIYFLYRLSSDIPFEQVQTGTFTVLAVCQWFNALNCRSEKRSAFVGLLANRYLILGLLVGNFMHMGVVFLPLLNRLFHTVAMPLSEVFIIGAIASLVLWVEELRKIWNQHKQK